MAGSDTQLLRLQLWAERLIAEAAQRIARALELDAMTGTGHQRRAHAGFGREGRSLLLSASISRSIPCPVLAEIAMRC